MPFDATGFPLPPPVPPPPPRRGNDNLVTALIVALAAVLLATPLSLAACTDIAHALHGAAR